MYSTGGNRGVVFGGASGYATKNQVASARDVAT